MPDDASTSQDAPLGGHCLCRAVRFEVTAPFVTAGYCHCTHCQRRTGGASSAQVRVPASAFRVVSGEDRRRSYQPEGGMPKVFCSTCGSSLFSGDPLNDDELSVRVGVLDAAPGRSAPVFAPR